MSRSYRYCGWKFEDHFGSGQLDSTRERANQADQLISQRLSDMDVDLAFHYRWDHVSSRLWNKNVLYRCLTSYRQSGRRGFRRERVFSCGVSGKRPSLRIQRTAWKCAISERVLPADWHCEQDLQTDKTYLWSCLADKRMIAAL